MGIGVLEPALEVPGFGRLHSMNKRQWFVLLAGTLSVAAIVVFGTIPLHPPVVGPVVETSPGHGSVTLTDAVVPMWVMATVFGLVALTGLLAYRSRTIAP